MTLKKYKLHYKFSKRFNCLLDTWAMAQAIIVWMWIKVFKWKCSICINCDHWWPSYVKRKEEQCEEVIVLSVFWKPFLLNYRYNGGKEYVHLLCSTTTVITELLPHFTHLNSTGRISVQLNFHGLNKFNGRLPFHCRWAEFAFGVMNGWLTNPFSLCWIGKVSGNNFTWAEPRLRATNTFPDLFPFLVAIWETKSLELLIHGNWQPNERLAIKVSTG